MLPIPNPSPTEIKEAVLHLYRKWKLHFNEKRFNLATEGRNNPRLLEILKTLYQGHDFLEFEGTTFPIIQIKMPDQQSTKPESILGILHSDRTAHVDQHLYAAGQKYLNLLLEVGRPLTNLPTYCLDKIISTSEELKINCIMGSYYDALISCDILEWEILTEIERFKPHEDPNKFIEKNLKLRGYVHRLCGYDDPVVCTKGRSAALSVSTTIIFNRGTDYAMLVGERSKQGVAVHGDLYHVVPSGMFQPIVGDLENEFSVYHSFLREYMEELFGLAEVQNPPSAISHDYFYNDSNLDLLRMLYASGEAQLFLTGFVINALNLRPEICTMLFIKTPRWFDAHKRGLDNVRRIELNEEWKRPNEKLSGKPNVVPITELRNFGLHSGNVVPPGAAAIILGLQTARSVSLI